MANKWNEKLNELSQDLDELSKKASAAADDAKAAWDLKDDYIQEKISTAKGNVAAMQENVRIAEEENKGKLSSAMLKAQMTVRAKMEDRKDARDKRMLENYIDGHIEYVLDCYDAAALLVANAQLAILETMDAAIEYENRFGKKEEAGESTEA